MSCLTESVVIIDLTACHEQTWFPQMLDDYLPKAMAVMSTIYRCLQVEEDADGVPSFAALLLPPIAHERCKFLYSASRDEDPNPSRYVSFNVVRQEICRRLSDEAATWCEVSSEGDGSATPHTTRSTQLQSVFLALCFINSMRKMKRVQHRNGRGAVVVLALSQSATASSRTSLRFTVPGGHQGRKRSRESDDQVHNLEAIAESSAVFSAVHAAARTVVFGDIPEQSIFARLAAATGGFCCASLLDWTGLAALIDASNAARSSARGILHDPLGSSQMATLCVQCMRAYAHGTEVCPRCGGTLVRDHRT